MSRTESFRGVAPHRPRLRSLRDRIVEGEHRWGRLEVRPTSGTMWTGRTLVVFPPGTNTRERLLLRLWHQWLFVAAGGAIVLLAASSTEPWWTGTLLAALWCAAGTAVLRRATHRTRPAIRSITVTLFLGVEPPEATGDVARLERCLTALRRAERELRDGVVDPVRFEAAWAAAYAAMPTR